MNPFHSIPSTFYSILPAISLDLLFSINDLQSHFDSHILSFSFTFPFFDSTVLSQLGSPCRRVWTLFVAFGVDFLVSEIATTPFIKKQDWNWRYRLWKILLLTNYKHSTYYFYPICQRSCDGEISTKCLLALVFLGIVLLEVKPHFTLFTKKELLGFNFRLLLRPFLYTLLIT